MFEALLSLEHALAHPKDHSGLGLRKLHSSGIWEVRLGIDLRAIFRLQDDAAEFAFLGTHDEVRRFLRNL
jgi:mRNA-degrading endonuclease YafQ of YafQ-DinJ toxin-antitoxin module